MNKNKIILSSIGGVAIVATLVLAYMSYSTYSDCSMQEEDLEISKSSVTSIQNAKIAPTETSVKAIDANRKKLIEWQDGVLAVASKGDMSVNALLTPAAFKQAMVDDAREMSKLPGGVNGHIVAENFGFGFTDIITGGSMPDASRLGLLQRQWAEIKLFVGIFSKCAVAELKRIEPVAVKIVAEDASSRNKNKKGSKKVEEKKGPDSQSYEITFTAKPASFVRVLNALATNDRFVTVDEFSFARENDVLSNVLGGGKEPAQATANVPRRQRNRRGAQRQNVEDENGGTGEKAEAMKKGLVIDPATEAPIVIRLKLSTFDFGTKSAGGEEKTPKAEKGEDEE